MFPGGLTTQAPGRAEHCLCAFEVEHLGGRTLRVRFAPMPAYANRYWGVYVNGVRREVVYAPAGQVTGAYVAADPGDARATVYVEDFGDWAALADGQAPDAMAEEREAAVADRLSFAWRAPAEHRQSNGLAGAPRGDDQLSALIFEGARRFSNTSAVPGHPRRATLTYGLRVENGQYALRWWKENELVAAGYRSGDGVIVCEPVGASGLRVTATLAYTHDLPPDSAQVELRWPEQYQLHYATATLNFPRTPEARVADVGRDAFAARSAPLAPGAYQAAVVPVLDGVPQMSGVAVIENLIVADLPSPVTDLVASGGAAATVLSWTSQTAGAHYTVYAGGVNEPVNFGDFAAPAPIVTAADANGATLAAVTGYPGIVRVVVRATLGGAQERHDREYLIEYDAAGNIVLPRPNRASIDGLRMDGLAMTAEAMVLAVETDVTATAVDLFIAAEGEAFDFDTPAASEALASPVHGLQRATLLATFPEAGWYRVAVRARSAAGARSLAWAERWVWASEAEPAGVDDLRVTVRGGWKE